MSEKLKQLIEEAKVELAEHPLIEPRLGNVGSIAVSLTPTKGDPRWWLPHVTFISNILMYVVALGFIAFLETVRGAHFIHFNVVAYLHFAIADSFA